MTSIYLLTKRKLELFAPPTRDRKTLLAALQKHNWNQTRAATYLKITRSTLLYRMQKFGLERPKTSDDAADESEPPTDAA